MSVHKKPEKDCSVSLLMIVCPGVGEFFRPTFDTSGMNHQQRNRALFELFF
jgi:hypothetical protein